MSDFLSTVRKDFTTSYTERVGMDEPIVIQGVWTWAISHTVQIYGGFLNNAGSNNLNDQVDFEVFLKPGRYRLSVLSAFKISAGIMGIYLNDIYIGECDCRSIPEDFNHWIYFDIYTGETKNHKLSFKVIGTSGAGHQLYITYFNIRRVL